MNNEEMMAIAEKIKNNTASPEEVIAFTEAFTKLMGDIKTDLEA